MRLITKTTLVYLFIALLVFGLGGYLTYQVLKRGVAKETDYSLSQNLGLLLNSIKERKPLDALENGKITIRKIPSSQVKDTLYAFSDTLAMHPYWKRLEPHRKLKVTRRVNGEYYQIQMIDNFLELDDLFNGVFGVLSRLFISLGVVLLLCSFLISRWLFKPFQRTLEQIKSFNLKSDEPIQLTTTSTKEFQQLNTFVSTMTAKANSDYQALKEFSENAAHEMQTPIAIAKGKLELLLEHPDLQSEQLQLIESAQTSLTKLSRLGQSLSLLTKIDNEEFANPTLINLSTLVTNNVDNFQSLCELKGLNLTSSIEKEVYLNIHSALADILVGNLLKNAVRHNIHAGWIDVILNKDALIIKNSGLAPKIPTEQLFERFRKSNQSSNSLGLGLAIVKKISVVNQLKVSYAFESGVHQLRVGFPEKG